MNPSEIVSLFSLTTKDLSSRIGSIDKHWSSDDFDVSGKFFYIKFRNNAPAIEELLAITFGRIVNFCIPRWKIKETLAEISDNPEAIDAMVSLVSEARNLFIKTREETGRSGELGETLLYMITEWILEAPILACKMYLKTSLQMPIHGTDGIHLGHKGDNLVLYWGESKLHTQLNSALSDIMKSITEHIVEPQRRENEIRIIQTNLNTEGLSLEELVAIKNYFNPYKPESNKLLESYACLAGFDTKLYNSVEHLPPGNCEEKFRERYEKKIDSVAKLILKNLKRTSLPRLSFSFFLLPFPSVDEARRRFQQKLWGQA